MTDDTAYEDAKVVLERIRDRRHRRTFIGHCLAGVAVAGVIVFIVTLVFIGVTRQQVRHAEIARQCVAAGNIWAHDECLIAKK